MIKPKNDEVDTTTISVSKGLRDTLWKLKEHYTESYETLIRRLIKEAGYNDQ